MSVTRLIDRVSIACSDDLELADWLLGWAESFKAGEYGKFRSVVVVVESDDGQVGLISQSLGVLDRTRLVGLLMQAAHRRMDNGADIARLEVDGK